MPKKFFLKSIICVIWILICVISAFSQEKEEIRYLEEEKAYFITLTRKAEPKKDLPTNVSVITAEEIKNLGARNFAEAINYLNSVNVGKYGTLGAMSSVILRGALDKQVLVLIDGRSANDITLGGYNYSEISIENIDRIEIIRGAASSIYGANALAGVVNVITKRPSLEQPMSKINTSWGSYGEQIYNFNFGTKRKNVETLFTASKNLAQGFRENSNCNNTNFTAMLGLETTNLGKITFRSGLSNFKLGVPGKNNTPTEQWNNNKEKKAYDPLAEQTTNKVYLLLEYERKLGSRLQLSSRIYGNIDKGNYKSPKSLIDDSTDKKTIGLETQFDLPNNLILGIELREDGAERTNEIAKTTDFDKKINLTSIYAQNKFVNLDQLNALIGVRYDYHSLFGGETNPQLSVVWHPLPNWKLSTNIGRGYRAPTFEDLFSPYSSWPAWPPFPGGDTQGNPEVKPETSWSYDLGIEKNWNSKISSQFILFRQKIENLIEWSNISTDPDWEKWRPSNVAQAYNQGVEMTFVHQIKENLSYDFNYTYLESRGKKITEQDYKILMYRPEHTVNCKISYLTPWKTNFILSGKYVGKQFDDMNNKISDYNLLNFRLEQKLNTNIKIFVYMENITDTRYFTRAGYPLPGRTFSGGISIGL
ncbi:MAG TPA: hypothetical protein DHV62_08450 [Elusimicrobia bacterium]|jgi:outer membrane receptor for ferrienterochelin and colicins|nr:hypothetical protein [Elusimicrobiota bacterium]